MSCPEHHFKKKRTTAQALQHPHMQRPQSFSDPMASTSSHDTHGTMSTHFALASFKHATRQLRLGVRTKRVGVLMGLRHCGPYISLHPPRPTHGPCVARYTQRPATGVLTALHFTSSPGARLLRFRGRRRLRQMRETQALHRRPKITHLEQYAEGTTSQSQPGYPFWAAPSCFLGLFCFGQQTVRLYSTISVIRQE